MEIKRTFEFIEYALKHHPYDDAFNIKRNGEWQKFSTQEIKDNADAFSSALIDMGFRKGDKILTVTNNRPEWNIADIGMEQIGVIHVPVYPTLSEKGYDHIIRHSDSKMIIVSSEEKYNFIKPIAEKIKEVEHIVTFDNVQGVNSFDDIIHAGKETVGQNTGKLQQYRADVLDTDVCSIIYTSGTTGAPKGVMLSHKNLVLNALASLDRVPDECKKTISFLPINHVFERGFNHTCIRKGIKIYYATSTDKLVDEIQEVKPHVFITVPRLLEKIYDKIYLKGLELKGVKKGIFFSSLRSAQKYEEHKTQGLFLKAKLAFDNKMVFSKWREALGGEIKMIISGGAALQPRLARVFSAAKIPVIEGYGLTETSPSITANIIGKIRPGSVGKLLDTSEVKIANDGEILYKGPCLMKGYYKDRERTEDAIDKEGWFHTGDMGEMEGDYLKITGRKKELFKLSTGNYVAPQVVENIMKESPFIEQIMVIGENERFCSALISPNFEHLKNWAEIHEIDSKTNLELVQNEQVKQKFQEEIDELNYDVDSVMTIKKFSLCHNEWGADTGELTPTLKLRRDFIINKYQEKRDFIYGYREDDVFI
jgi:long-chain acyl-CoA synthetase